MRANTGRRGATSGASGALDPEDRRRFAAYTADMAGALARLARNHKLDTLAYLLDMARMEAHSVSGDEWVEPPGLN